MKALFALGLLMCCVLTIGMPAVRAQEQGVENIEAFVEDWIAAEQEAVHIPGVITALVIDGETVMARGFGFADLERERRADADTPFRVGSVSKPVTASLALLAMEEFAISADTDLRPLFAGLPLRPELAAPLRFHDLLTHSAGFSESLSGQHVRSPEDFRPLADYLGSRLPPRFEEPGVIITYNDHHTALAGYAIEQAAGMRFEDYGAQALFEPIGMARSTFDQLDIFQSEIMSRSYAYGDGAFEAYVPDLIMTPPAAGFATTAADMGRYLEFLLSDPRVAAQSEVQFENDPRLRGRSYGFVETMRGGHLVLYKDGQANGFGARLVIVPELGLGIFVAINRSVLGPMGRSNEAGRFLRAYTSAILNEVIPSMDHGDALVPTAVNAPLEQYVGSYRTTVAARHTWEMMLAATDTIEVSVTESGGISLGGGAYIPVGEGIFQWHEGGPFFLGFEDDARGRVKYLLVGGGSYERVPWYGAQHGTGLLLMGVLGIAALFAVVWAILSYLGRSQLWNKLTLAGAIARLGFAGILITTFILLDPQEIFYGMPTGLAAAIGVALMGLAFDAMGLVTFFSTRRDAIALGGATIYFASTAVFALWLHYWNLLGWQTG